MSSKTQNWSTTICGLYGVIGNGIIQNDLKAFYILACLNQFRGKDATGVARIWRDGYGDNKKYRYEIRKDVLNAQDFYERKENKNVLKSALPVAIMGHNRWATVGAKEDINGAHPFDNERFVGFHNGTLRDKKHNEDRKFLTDSESLYDELAKSENPANVLETLESDSAFALAYFDKTSNRVGFIRNSHRSLFFATNQDRNVIYYSSEEEMLDFTLTRLGIKFETIPLGPWRLCETYPDDVRFVYTGEGKERYRDAGFYVDILKPNPPEKPVVKTHVPQFQHRHSDVLTYPPRGRSIINPLKCSTCGDEMEYANGANGRSKEQNPVLIDGELYCSECSRFWLNIRELEDRPNQVIVN